ncbi:mannosyltransferase [Elysia marginata]|uniref:Mannosyltransferase n=1 Tax=Elysia marginata TaxID=1093978 RepID=A0AAV4FB68_9GAST|nr:mannosyltransferase [Elysia marginata]
MIFLFFSLVPDKQVFRLSHVAVTSLLPLAVSKFAEVTCKCPDVASLAAILTGTSAFFSILGSHTLINSFVSPAIFVGLAQAVHVLHDTVNRGNHSFRPPGSFTFSKGRDCVFTNDKKGETQIGFDDNNHSADVQLSTSDLALSTWTDHIQNKVGEIEENSAIENNTQFPIKNTIYSCEDLGSFSDASQRYAAHDASCQSMLDDLGYASKSSRSSSSSSSNGSVYNNYHDSDDEFSSYSKRFFVDNDNLHVKKHKSLDTLSSDEGSQNPQLYSVVRQDKNHYWDVTANIVCGLLLSASMYIRPDTSLLVSCVLLGNHKLSKTASVLRSGPTWQLAVGGILGLFLAVVNDTIFYGTFVLTPINWARLNVFSNTACKLFGVSGWYFYMTRVFLRDSSMCVASIVFIAAVASSVYQFVALPSRDSSMYSQCESINADRKTCRRSLALPIFGDESLNVHIACVITLTAFFSCMGHKEERFLHDTVIVFLIAVSQAVLKVVDFIESAILNTGHYNPDDSDQERDVPQSSCSAKRSKQLALVLLFSTAFAAHQIHVFRSPFEIQRLKWYKPSGISDLDTTLCMHFLSKQQDVTGLFIDRNIKDTGGYSILHKNIPLLYLLGDDFVEFTNSSLLKERRTCVIGPPYDDNIAPNRHSESSGGRINSTRINIYASQGASDIESSSASDFKKAILKKRNGNKKDNQNNLHKDVCNVGYFSINMISDLIHKDNTVALFRKIIGIRTVAGPDHSHSNHQLRGHQDHHHPRQTRQVPQQQQQQQKCQNHRHPPNRPIPHYNYAIVEADKPFLSPAFRPVYKTATMCVWRRVNTPHTESRLRATFHHIQGNVNTRNPGNSRSKDTETQRSRTVEGHLHPDGARSDSEDVARQNSSQRATQSIRHDAQGNGSNGDSNHIPTSVIMMEYEGETLKQLGNYWAAMTRFETIALTSRGYDLRGKVKVSVLAAMVFCLHRLGEEKKMQAVLTECVISNSRDQCLDGWRSNVSKLASKLKSG